MNFPDSRKLSQKYDFPKYGVELIVEKKSSNYIEIAVKNKQYTRHKQSLGRLLVVLCVLYLMSIPVIAMKVYLSIHVVFVAVLVCITFQLVILTDQELLKVAEDFGIEKLTFFTFGRRSRVFVPINRVHRIVINEVIYFVSLGTPT